MMAVDDHHFKRIPGASPRMGRNAWGRDFEMWPAVGGGWCGVMRAVDRVTGEDQSLAWWMADASAREHMARYDAGVGTAGKGTS